MPYAIYNVTDNVIVKRSERLPASLQVGKRRLVAPCQVGDEGVVDGKLYRLVELVSVGADKPGDHYRKGNVSEKLAGNTLTVSQQWDAYTQAEIDADEHERAIKAERSAASTKLHLALFRIVNDLRVLKSQPKFDRKQFNTWLGQL